MSSFRNLVITSSLLSLFGCTPLLAPTQPSSTANVFVYLEPTPTELSRLTLRFHELEAVTDSATYALSRQQPQLAPQSSQQLLASGQLPPGHYTGFQLRLESGQITTELGRSTLQLDKPTIFVSAPFNVAPGQVQSLNLRLRQDDFSPNVPIRETLFSLSHSKPIPTEVLGVVGDVNNKALVLVDRSLGRVNSMLGLEAAPVGLAADSQKRQLFVSDSTGQLAVYALPEFQKTRQTQLRGGAASGRLLLTPDGLLVLCRDTNEVLIIDPDSLSERARLIVGDGPEDAAYATETQQLAIFSWRSGTVQVFDLRSRQLQYQVQLGFGPVSGVWGHDQHLYVTRLDTQGIWKIDGRSGQVLERFYTGAGYQALKQDPVDDLFYGVTDGGEIAQLEPFTLSMIQTWPGSRGRADILLDARLGQFHVLFVTGQLRSFRFGAFDSTATLQLPDVLSQMAIFSTELQ